MVSTGNNNQYIIQPSSALRPVNVSAGEQTQFLQKKHGSPRIGLCGLPNVGKSSLFNLLSSLRVPASNYAFCTIDPNICKLPIIDTRFAELAAATAAQTARRQITPRVHPPVLNIVDIAGIVRLASLGKGLGNQFLHHISTVSVIVQVVRCFDDKHTGDDNVEHVDNYVDPIRDITTIHEELIEKDIEQFYKRIARINRPVAVAGRSTSDAQETDSKLSILLKAHTWLVETRRPLRECFWTPIEAAYLATLQMWTSKPMCYVLNMSIYQYCSDSLRNEICQNVQTTFHHNDGNASALHNNNNQQHSSDVSFLPISVIYEQARVAYTHRYVPFTQLPAAQQRLPSFAPNSTDEKLCCAALGREIQLLRHASFLPSEGAEYTATAAEKVSHEEPSKKKSSKSSHKKSSSSSTSSSSSRSHKKDKSSTSTSGKKHNSSSTPATASDSFDFGGGFAEFLGDLDSEPSAPSHSHHHHHHHHTDSSSTSPPVAQKQKKKPPAAALPSAEFWQQVDAFLVKYDLRPTLRLIAVQDSTDIPPELPLLPSQPQQQPQTQVPTTSPSNPDTAMLSSFASILDTTPDQDENEEQHDASSEEHAAQKSSNAPNDAQESEDDELADDSKHAGYDDLLAQTRGKVLLLDDQHPTPLAQLVRTSCNLARIIQFFVSSDYDIRGIMVPADSTAPQAGLRLNFDICENFHSCDVIHFKDLAQAAFNLAAARDAGKVVTRSRKYIVQDGDWVSFKTKRKFTQGPS